MGKQIIAKRHPTTAVYRFYGKFIYLKSNSPQYGDQLIAQIRAKGGTVEQGNGWFKCDIMGSNEVVKLGSVEIESNVTPLEDVEEILCHFFKNTLDSQGFKTEVTSI